MQLVDSHCHLDSDEFDHDRTEVIARARAAGVMRQVVPAIDADGWPRLREICAADLGLFPAYGLHPMLVASHQPAHLGSLRHWIECERPVAIGECGLDFYMPELDAVLQQHYFDGQLLLAMEFDLPLIVHARRALEAVILSLKRFDGVRGVIHSFSGSIEQARQLWSMGFMIGLGGPVTHERANRLRKLAATMPIDYLLLETDAPDQPDAQHRGQRNEPARLTNVLHTIAQLRRQDPEGIAAATTANAERLFALH